MVAEGFSPTEGGCNQLIIKSPNSHLTALQLLGYTSRSSIVGNTTHTNDAHKQQPASSPPTCSPDYYHGSISGWEASKVTRRKSTVRPLPHGGRGFLFMPNGTSQAPEAHFVPLAKGQTYAGSLEKAAGTATGATKARAGADTSANTETKRTIKPRTGEPENRRTEELVLNSQFSILNSQFPNPSRRAARAMPLDH